MSKRKKNPAGVGNAGLLNLVQMDKKKANLTIREFQAGVKNGR